MRIVVGLPFAAGSCVVVASGADVAVSKVVRLYQHQAVCDFVGLGGTIVGRDVVDRNKCLGLDNVGELEELLAARRAVELRVWLVAQEGAFVCASHHECHAQVPGSPLGSMAPAHNRRAHRGCSRILCSLGRWDLRQVASESARLLVLFSSAQCGWASRWHGTSW